MFDKLTKIIELIKLLYIQIAITCRSDCVIGRDNNIKTPPPSPINAANSPSNDDNNNNHTTTSII